MGETHGITIMIAAIFTNNILLTTFLGMCPFQGCSKELRTSLGLGAAVVFVTTFTTLINYFIYHFLLVPFGLEMLNYIVFIAVIAAFVQFVEMFIDRVSPPLYQALGIFLPLITVNCAILGTSLFMVVRDYDFGQTLGWSVGAGLGWALAILLIAGLRKKMIYSNVPPVFRNVPIVMLITGIMAMAFMGFAGMVGIT